MTLGAKQRLFTELSAKLILEIGLRGYKCTYGRAFEDPAWNTGGHPRSLHKSRLAIDLNLFKPFEGGWLYCAETADHEPFGVWWEKQHALCRWGGRFNDGNHYSLAHGGMK